MALPALLMKAAPWALGALGFLGGSQKNKQTQTTTSAIDPTYSPLQQALLASAMQRLNAPSALPAGYESSGISKINDTFRTVQQGVGNRAAAQGVSGGPGEQYAMNNIDMARAGQIADFRTGLPLMERDMANQNFQQAANVLGTGRYDTTTTNTQGGGLGGGLSGLGGILGFLYGQNGAGGGSGAKSPAPAGGSNNDLFAQLFKLYGGSMS